MVAEVDGGRRDPTVQRTTTVVTLVIVVLWFATVIARVRWELPQAVVLDSAMPPVIGYWFAAVPGGLGKGKAS